VQLNIIRRLGDDSTDSPGLFSSALQTGGIAQSES
jgi:hypothetical protein